MRYPLTDRQATPHMPATSLPLPVLHGGEGRGEGQMRPDRPANAPEAQMRPYPLTDRQASPHISPPPVSLSPYFTGRGAGVRGRCAPSTGHRRCR